MLPYRYMPIVENNEPLAPLPADKLALASPHPYQALGAPYGDVSPWLMRETLVHALLRVAEDLDRLHKGWKLKIYDALRPNAVQSFMVEVETRSCAQRAGLDPAHLTAEEHQAMREQALRIWADPSEDPLTPPPHSTGAVLDLTIQDDQGAEIFMGSAVDENSERSAPAFFDQDPSPEGKLAAANRVLLNDLMSRQGFCRITGEWWHFSCGDQYWAWIQSTQNNAPEAVARYGRVG